MTVCSFFLQGRCRYGEKCWNEHPRGGGGGGGRGGGGGGGDYGRGGGGDYSRGTPQSNRGVGGFGNRVWVNPQRAGGDFVKPSTFGGRDNSKNTSFGVSTQNRFGSLNTPSSFDRGGAKDENEKHLETIQKDMEIWETSGQWPLSCYSVLKGSISGFVELSQDELRLEYYNGRTSGDLQTYGNSVTQLASQWRNRVQELRAMNGSTRSAVLAELNNPGQETSSFGSAPSQFGSSSTGFGSSAPSGFGSTTSSGFGTAPTSGFGAGGFGAPAQSSASFSFAPTQSGTASGFGAAQPQSQSGFGSASAAAPSASSFSFAAPAASATKDTPSGFGVSASNFSFTSAAAPSSTGGFGGGGGGFGTSTGSSGFGQPSSGSTNSGLFASGGAAAALAAASAGAAASGLFTPQSELTADELREFSGKRFTLGQIPLKPPPADMLVI